MPSVWGLVRLPFAQQRVPSLGKVSGDGDDGAAMSVAWSESERELADMAVAGCLDPDGAGGRIEKAPLEEVVGGGG